MTLINKGHGMQRLEIARLYLRPFTVDDLTAHHQMVGSDPQVIWHGKALTLEESRAARERRMNHREQHGFGMWAVVEKETGNLLGHAGLQMLENTDEVEPGYYFGRPAWGKGIAPEAGSACLRYGFETLALTEIVAVVRPENNASQRVLTKLGLHYVRDAHHYGFDVQYWQIARADFQPRDAFYDVLP
jgi:RimJ/RimL family protein N-acetyltransferase